MDGNQEQNAIQAEHEQPYDYLLPEDRIADRPCYPFHDAKMLVVARQKQEFHDSQFSILPELLREKDVLVLNNTRVVKARLFGSLKSSGAPCEFLLTEDLGQARFQAMGKPLRKMKPGVLLEFGDGLSAEVVQRVGDYFVELQFHSEHSNDVYNLGVMPIPPYIRDGRGDIRDERDYQTPYARFEGSVAAPTAGLHFTNDLLSALRRNGVKIVEVTLHVGPASFLSVWEDANEEKKVESAVRKSIFVPPGSEKGYLPIETAQELLSLKENGNRIVAVGTTVVRLLETAFSLPTEFQSGEFSTQLFIKPGYKFSFVDAMITNFHQPRSSHLLLVEAFLGRSLLGSAYHLALENDYRFLSYGDGMFIE